jgi:hypothetical protein
VSKWHCMALYGALTPSVRLPAYSFRFFANSLPATHSTVTGKVIRVHTMKPYRKSGGIAPLILNLDTRGDDGSDSCPARFIHGTHSTGGWVDPRVGLDGYGEQKMSSPPPPPGVEPQTVQPPARRYCCLLLLLQECKIWFFIVNVLKLHQLISLPQSQCFRFWHCMFNFSLLSTNINSSTVSGLIKYSSFRFSPFVFTS